MGRYAFDWEGKGGLAGASRDQPPQGSFRDPKEGWRGSPPLSDEPIKPEPPRRQAGDNDVGSGAGSRPDSVPPSQQELKMTDKSKPAREMRHANQSDGKKAQGAAADAQHELNRPDQAKGRPPAHGPSNAGEDGGA